MEAVVEVETENETVRVEEEVESTNNSGETGSLKAKKRKRKARVAGKDVTEEEISKRTTERATGSENERMDVVGDKEKNATRPRTEETEKEQEKNNKENNDGSNEEEYVLPVCVLNGSKAQKEAIAYPGTILLDSELDREHLTFLLMREEEHRLLKSKYKFEAGPLEKRGRVRAGKKMR